MSVSLSAFAHYLKTLSREHVLFMLRISAAVLVAIGVAALLGLEYPYWAGMTVVVVTQPLRGMIWTKGLFRLVGTLIGALFGVALSLSLHDQPMIMLPLLAVWVAACAASANLLAGFRGYGATLAGITAALVCLLTYDKPDNLIHLSSWRALEVLIGVVVAGLFAMLVPASNRDQLLSQLESLTNDTLALLQRRLQGVRHTDDAAKLERLFIDIAQLDNQLLNYTAGSVRWGSKGELIRDLLANLTALLLHVERDGVREAIDATPDDQARLLEQIAELQMSVRLRQPVHDALCQLPAVVANEWQPLAQLLRSLAETLDQLPQSATAKLYQRLKPHYDFSTAGTVFLRTLLVVGTAMLIWQISRWPVGNPMTMAAALMCCIFATHPAANIGIRSSLLGTFFAFTLAVIVREWLITEPVNLLLGTLYILPVILLATLFISRRETLIFGTEFGMIFLFISEPGTYWSHPSGYVVILGSGILLGVTLATLLFNTAFIVNPERRVRALLAAMQQDLREQAAGKRKLSDPAAIEQRAFALVNLAPQAGLDVKLAAQTSLNYLKLLQALHSLQQVQQSEQLPAEIRQALTAALARLQEQPSSPDLIEQSLRHAQESLVRFLSDEPAHQVAIAASNALLSLQRLANHQPAHLQAELQLGD